MLVNIIAIDNNKEQMLSEEGVDEPVENGEKKKGERKEKAAHTFNYINMPLTFSMRHLIFVNIIVKRCCIICFTF